MRKRKSSAKTYLVQHKQKNNNGEYMVLDKYKVGAKNEKEAEHLLKKIIGKNERVSVSFKEQNKLSYGTIIREKE